MQVGQPNETVIGNLTVAAPAITGHTRVFTCGTPMPEASTPRSLPGRSTATAAAVKLDGGATCASTYPPAPIMIWDRLVVGQHPVGTTDALVAHAPERKLDTRKRPAVGGRGIQVIRTGPRQDDHGDRHGGRAGRGRPPRCSPATSTAPGIDNPRRHPQQLRERPHGEPGHRQVRSERPTVTSASTPAARWICCGTRRWRSSQVKAAPPRWMYDSRPPYGSP